MPPLCSALVLAHTRGIVHRDLKPANVVAHDFAPADRVYKIVDFGVANVRQLNDDTRLTGSQQFIGTVAYASPEQLTGGAVDARSDVYSLGAVVFELLTGRLPFEGQDAMAMVSGHLSKPVPVPSNVRPGLPAWIDLAVARALAKNPEDRWQDMAAFGARPGGHGNRPSPGAGGQPAAAAACSAPTRSARCSGPVASAAPCIAACTGRSGIRSRSASCAVEASTMKRCARASSTRRGRCRWRTPRSSRCATTAKKATSSTSSPTTSRARACGRSCVESGALPWPRLSRFASQLIEAAHALHRRKGLLCGLSPDIVRITQDEDGERLMISSAGIWQAQDLLGTLQEQTLRGTELADGELRYVAPELFTGRTADVRSDVFTLGVLIYEMATGQLPFDGATLPELLGKMLSGGAQDPRELQPSIPEPAAGAIRTALNPAPEKRFAARAISAPHSRAQSTRVSRVVTIDAERRPTPVRAPSAECERRAAERVSSGF